MVTRENCNLNSDQTPLFAHMAGYSFIHCTLYVAGRLLLLSLALFSVVER